MSAEVLINESSLIHNLKKLANVCSPAELMFVVKSNAYGHSAELVSKIAYQCGIRFFGCLEVDLAIRVSELVGQDSRLLVWQLSRADDFRGLNPRIEVGVGSLQELALIESAGLTFPVKVHLKVDTGLNRNGVPAAGWEYFLQRVSEVESTGKVEVVAVWTHINEASDAADVSAREGFCDALSIAERVFSRKLLAHLAASSASFRLPDFRFDFVRVGGHAFGIPSFDGITPKEMGLIPVMTLTAPVSTDSAGRTFVAAGYLDGIPGYAAGKASICVEGNLLLIDRVEADRTYLHDLTSGATGTAYIFGDGENGEQTVRQWGDLLGTLGDEITSRIPARIPRKLV